jgi:hypothetical protein
MSLMSTIGKTLATDNSSWRPNVSTSDISVICDWPPGRIPGGLHPCQERGKYSSVEHGVSDSNLSISSTGNNLRCLSFFNWVHMNREEKINYKLIIKLFSNQRLSYVLA